MNAILQFLGLHWGKALLIGLAALTIGIAVPKVINTYNDAVEKATRLEAVATSALATVDKLSGALTKASQIADISLAAADAAEQRVAKFSASLVANVATIKELGANDPSSCALPSAVGFALKQLRSGPPAPADRGGGQTGAAATASGTAAPVPAPHPRP
jgi:hypothetical protein